MLFTIHYSIIAAFYQIFSLDIVDTCRQYYLHSTLHTMSVLSGGGGEVKLLVVAPL